MNSSLQKTILFDPLMLDVNKLMILSGHATPNMTSWYLKNITSFAADTPIDISIIVGMTPYNGLSISVHEGFKDLMLEPLPREVTSLHCSYVFTNPPVHSNVYIWAKDNVPILAYMGSANFTQSSFITNQQELMAAYNPTDAFTYYSEIEARSIYCNHAEVEEYITLHPTHSIMNMENRPIGAMSSTSIESVTLSLLTRNGETGRRSGINWGQRDGRNKNEAYICVPSIVARSGFFPLGEQHFTVVTDDLHQLILRIEQQNDKAITTPLSNAQLGEYLRNRLGMPNGSYIQRENLEQYGRTDITFYKLDEEQYYMDFSV